MKFSITAEEKKISLVHINYNLTHFNFSLAREVLISTAKQSRNKINPKKDTTSSLPR